MDCIIAPLLSRSPSTKIHILCESIYIFLYYTYIYPNTINYFTFVSLDYFSHLIILSDFYTIPILKL